MYVCPKSPKPVLGHSGNPFGTLLVSCLSRAESVSQDCGALFDLLILVLGVCVRVCVWRQHLSCCPWKSWSAVRLTSTAGCCRSNRLPAHVGQRNETVKHEAGFSASVLAHRYLRTNWTQPVVDSEMWGSGTTVCSTLLCTSLMKYLGVQGLLSAALCFSSPLCRSSSLCLCSVASSMFPSFSDLVTCCHNLLQVRKQKVN